MCGIAAFLGKKGKKFNSVVLNYLMLAQDSRGKDNCGVAYHIVSEKTGKDAIRVRREANLTSSGGEDKSTFNKVFDKEGKFWYEDTPPVWSKDCFVIAHSRSISRGSSKRSNAHPFVAYDNIEKPTRTIIGVHNGTITNEYTIERHFEFPTNSFETDSELIFNCIAKGEKETLEVLSMYRGSAALVWKVREQPQKTFIWVGKDSISYGTNKTSERPLHYIQTTAGIYISSEYGPIEKIFKALPNRKQYTGTEEIEVYHFRMDHITVIENGKITEEIEVKRTPGYVATSGTTGGYLTKKNESDLNENCETSCDMPITNRYINKNKNIDNSAVMKIARDVLKKDTYSTEELNDFSTRFKLYVIKGLYYLGGKLVTNQVSEIPSYPEDLGVAALTKDDFYVTPLYFTEGGVQVVKSYGVGYTYIEWGTKVSANVINCYFYKGHLLKNENSFITLWLADKDNRDKNKSISMNDLRAATDIPIWCGTTVTKEDTADLVTFIPPKALTDKGRQPLNGVIEWPLVKKGYLFYHNFPVEIIGTTRLKNLAEHGIINKLEWCNTCKTSTINKPCIMCSEVEDDLTDEEFTPESALDAYKAIFGTEEKIRVVCDDCAKESIVSLDSAECPTCKSLNIQPIDFKDPGDEDDVADKFLSKEILENNLQNFFGN